MDLGQGLSALALLTFGVGELFAVGAVVCSTGWLSIIPDLPNDASRNLIPPSLDNQNDWVNGRQRVSSCRTRP